MPAGAPEGRADTGVAPQPLPVVERAALIFIPGISRSWAEHSLAAVADDIVVALNRATDGLAFSSSATGKEEYGIGESAPSARRITVSRAAIEDEPNAAAVLDIYEFDYTRRLAARFEKRTVAMRALLVLWAIVRGLFSVRDRFGQKSAKTFVERLQFYAFVALLGLYAALLVLLVIALITSLIDAGTSVFGVATSNGSAPTPSPSPGPSPPGNGSTAADSATSTWTSVWDFLRSASEVVVRAAVPLVALVWLLLPPKHKLKEAITNSATDYLAVDYYLRIEEGADELHGGLLNLLEKLSEKGYRRVDLAGYSFGSIVAFNVVFPGEPPSGPVASLKTLVTIGSPFDLVRVVRPDYFANRRGLPEHPERWLNVYVPNDVLGSNFRNDPQQMPPDDNVMRQTTAQGAAIPTPENVVYLPGGLPAREPRLGDLLGFEGLKVHARYWDPSEQNETTCFDRLVKELYEGDTVVSAS